MKPRSRPFHRRNRRMHNCSKLNTSTNSSSNGSPHGRIRRPMRTSITPMRKGKVNAIVSTIRSEERIRELESCLLQEGVDKESAMQRVQEMFNELTKKQGTSTAEQEKTERRLMSKNEELQATLAELTEVRSTLSTLEHKYAHLQRKHERIAKENAEMKKELEEIRRELLERRRRSLAKKPLDLNQSLNASTDEGVDENAGQLILRQMTDKINQLKEENQRLLTTLETERAEHIAQQRDFHTAVIVAERGREEAQAEMTRWIEASKENSSADSSVWADLMRRFDKNLKRNALLAWTQAQLTAYPSLSVSNFSSDWSDGRAFCALIHNIHPDLIDRAQLHQNGCRELAVEKAMQMGVNIDPQIFSVSTPDWHLVMATVFELYKKYEFSEDSCL
ncbi:unnamed protein product [Cylicocyclus nassatus]|uniref:Calponin-homology (CH) domain-containing protein n=1 Tax=Cylicocyclus nassatus TaxID=53992 RepID=A0AA36GYB8_CYLNA|nr:unnamed protein product [Cylicocyclus nassatus]